MSVLDKVTSLSDGIEDARTRATYTLMDNIIKSSRWRVAFEAVMLGTNTVQVLRNQSLSQENKTVASGIAYDIGALGGAIGLIDISLITETAISKGLQLSDLTKGLQDIYEKTLMLPNIEGIPISSSIVNTTREVDVGEHAMIVQSTSQKQYWTDNAVPKLKEWSIEGYITTSLSIDNLLLVKPSLKMQLNFLDSCASSRRPVLFKDNRGEFMFVNIMTLQTTEEASYNNAIKISLTLREYKPFKISNVLSSVGTASTERKELAEGM